MKPIYICFLLTTIISMASCIGGTSKSENDNDSIKIIVLDSIDVPEIGDIVGTVGEGSSMNVLELLTEDGDTMYIETSNGAVVGGIGIGERIAVTYNTQNGMCHAMTSVNITALEHLWTQPAADGHTQSLELNEGGRVTTYDMNVEYDKWSLDNGKLLLHSPKKIASEQAQQTDTFDIMQLTDQNLVLMHGNMESEFTREN